MSTAGSKAVTVCVPCAQRPATRVGFAGAGCSVVGSGKQPLDRPELRRLRRQRLNPQVKSLSAVSATAAATVPWRVAGWRGRDVAGWAPTTSDTGPSADVHRMLSSQPGTGTGCPPVVVSSPHVRSRDGGGADR